MYFPRVDEDLLGRPRRRRRRRIVLVALALLGVALLAARLLAGERDAGTRASALGENTESLEEIAPPQIRLPPGLDDYLDPDVDTDEETNSGIPSYVSGEVQRGQTIFAALTERGVPPLTIQPVVNAVGELFDFRRSRSGDRFDAQLDAEGQITRFRYQVSPETVYEARLVGPGEYEAYLTEIPLDVEVFSLAATLEGSLFSTIREHGEQEALARKIVEIFQWDIDFSRDVRPGDAFRLIYEKVYLEGEFLRYGRILAIEYRGARARQAAFYFDNGEEGAYYTASGEPVERMFLRAPCRYRRISSRFNLERMHPVLGRVRPHYGVDYAADTGTPVYAAADGDVVLRDFQGAAGNIVAIRHPNGYRTAYAHLHGFADGLRVGQRVRQGDVIGYVGNTGRSTGPHLHFAMKRHGEFIDPLEHHDRRLEALSGRDLQEFERVRDRLRYQLEELILPQVDVEERAEEDATEELIDEGLEERGYIFFGEDQGAYDF